MDLFCDEVHKRLPSQIFALSEKALRTALFSLLAFEALFPKGKHFHISCLRTLFCLRNFCPSVKSTDRIELARILHGRIGTEKCCGRAGNFLKDLFAFFSGSECFEQDIHAHAHINQHSFASSRTQ